MAQEQFKLARWCDRVVCWVESQRVFLTMGSAFDLASQIPGRYRIAIIANDRIIDLKPFDIR